MGAYVKKIFLENETGAQFLFAVFLSMRVKKRRGVSYPLRFCPFLCDSLEKETNAYIGAPLVIQCCTKILRVCPIDI